MYGAKRENWPADRCRRERKPPEDDGADEMAPIECCPGAQKLWLRLFCRLYVRMSPSHGGNRGSNPLGDAN